MKLIFTLTVLLLFLTGPIEAQKLKKKFTDIGPFRETYFVDKATDMQHGPTWVVNSENKDTLTKGWYKNGMRDSIWTFSEKGEKQIEFDFTENKLLYVADEMLADSFLIQSGNEFVVDKVDRPLLFIGGKDEISRTIISKIHLTDAMRSNNLAGSLMLAYKFDEKGNISGCSKIIQLNPELEQQVNVAINSLTGRFLPAIYDGNPVSSLMYVNINVGPEGYDNNLPELEKPYIQRVNILYIHRVYRSEIKTVIQTNGPGVIPGRIQSGRVTVY